MEGRVFSRFERFERMGVFRSGSSGGKLKEFWNSKVRQFYSSLSHM